MTTAATPGRRTAAGWFVSVGAVLANAAVQALLVLGDPVPTPSPAFGARVAASALVLVLALWLITRAAVGRRGRAVFVWSVTVVVLATAAAVVHPLLAAAALLLGLAVLPVVAGHVRRRPLAYLLAVPVFVVVVLLGWAVALAVGFLVTGVGGAVLTWTWLGASAVLLVRWWVGLSRR